jgi:hypothetical protein
MELFFSPLEELFMLLIFVPSPHGDHTHVNQLIAQLHSTARTAARMTSQYL